MSYILDALKRADSERSQSQASGTPIAIAQPDRHPAGSPRGSRAAQLGLALGLIVLAAAGGWWWYERGTPTEQASPSPVPMATERSVSEPVSAPAPEPSPKVVTAVADPSVAADPAPSVAVVTSAPVLPILGPVPPPAPAPPPPPPAPPHPSTMEGAVLTQSGLAPPGDLIGGETPPGATNPPAPAPPASVTAVPRAAPAAPENRVVPPALSAADRTGLPGVKISGSSYSANPEHRMLIANGQMVKEGQEISPGLTLEVIGPRSAVFNHRGTRYNINY